MTDRQFTEGQRVWHRQRKQFATYLGPSWTTGESYVDFGHPDGHGDECRVTTAQLVPADEVDA
ncbi:hypothetical protein AB0F72_08350 [Actinoplanes sp. NPDC023936]|uniref:hypothetical protein n=1 Tax=Actinoplanes sp. NPDC023936 TaxID=3154910 RepID=UPI0034053AB9